MTLKCTLVLLFAMGVNIAHALTIASMDAESIAFPHV